MARSKSTSEPMTAFDWLVLGHDYNKYGQPTLPMKRLDIPIPPTPDGLHCVAYRLAGMAELLHRIARLSTFGTPARSVIFDAMELITAHQRALKQYRKDWEAELEQNPKRKRPRRRRYRVARVSMRARRLQMIGKIC